MKQQSKVLRHPNKEEIIRRLTEGESIRSIVKWLEVKYKKRKDLRLSNPTLQKFRKEFLQLEGQVLQDIQEKRNTEEAVIVRQQIQAKVAATNAYQDKINAIADTHLDVANKILRLDSIIEDRMEHWYNAIKSGEASASQGDKEIRAYMDRMMPLLQQYKKFVEGMADHTVEHTVNIKVFNDQIGIFRDIIREILSELEPEKAIKFMDMMSYRLSETNYTHTTQMVDVEVLEDISETLFVGNNDE